MARRMSVGSVASASHNNHQKRVEPPAKQRGLTLNVRVAGFKPHPSPYGDDHVQQYSFKLLANQDLPKIFGDDFFRVWTKVNPREQKLDGPVMKEISRTWNDYPLEFYRINRGIVLTAESVTYNNETGTAQIRFSIPKLHGGLDGMHTLKKLLEDLIPSSYVTDDDDDDDSSLEEVDLESEINDEDREEKVEPDRYINCEVWVGLLPEQVARLSQGRNTSRTVAPYGIMEIRGDFLELENAIKSHNKQYAAKVAFKPNQHIEGLDDFRPISVLEILQLLMAMDIENYSADDHPIEAYKNRAFGPTFFAPKYDLEGREDNPRSRREEYVQMFPLIGDFLELYDRLRLEIPRAYDSVKTNTPRKWSKVLAGKGNKKVSSREAEELLYVDPSGETKVGLSPTSLFFPIFSAFRAYLRKEDNQYVWMDESPINWPKDEFFGVCQRLAAKVGKAAWSKSSLHDVGRDEQVWSTCYETLHAELLANSRKKKDS